MFALEQLPPEAYRRRWDGLLCDVDGVLVDSTIGIEALWREVCRTHNRVDPSPDDWGHIVGCSMEYTVSKLFPTASPDRRAAIVRLVGKLETELPWAPVPGAVAGLRESARSIPRVALVTGASRERLARIESGLALRDLIDARICWEDGPGKPDPGPYASAARRLGLDPGRCLVVEDAMAGVTSAVSAGSDCVVLCRSSDAEFSRRVATFMAAGARAVVRDWTEITRAVQTVNGSSVPIEMEAFRWCH